jgi:hypothetical protein
MKKLWSFAFAISLCLLCMTEPAWATVGGTVTPNSATPGGTVTMTGTVPVPGCPVPGTVILQGIGLWADPSGFIAGPYDDAGHFTVHGELSSRVTRGTHAFLIRCAGRNEPLGPAAGGEIGPGRDATFTVIGDLPRTGGSLGPVSEETAVIIASALIALGLITLWAGSRRSRDKQDQRHLCR